MPRCSAFNSTRFSSRPRHAELIYRQMVSDLGAGQNYSDDFDSLAMARVYANAMTFGRAKEALERAGKQFRPSRVLELLPTFEAEYGITPEVDATIDERRRELAAAMRIARGASRVNVEAVLSEILSDDFVSYSTVDKEDAVQSSDAPEEVGIYVAPGTQRSVYRVLDSIAITGEAVTVAYEYVTGAEEQLRIGDKIVIDSGDFGRCEAVTIAAVAETEDGLTFTATFAQPHVSGLLIATGRHPNLVTSKRHNLIVLSESGAVSARVRRRAHRTLRRLLRGISTWSLADSSGPFRVGVGRLGVTTIGAV